MKALLSAAAAAGVLWGISSIAVAATPPGHACDKGCAHKPGAPPQAATPRAEAPARGPADARVTVEVWSDFQCPFCARGAERLTQLREKYGDKVRVVFRHQPLPFHEHARLAAAASMAAHEQGRFWEFHDALFTQQRALDRGSLEALAGKLGLDVHRFRQALDSGAYDNYLDAEGVEAQRRGIAGTPTFFINGTPVVGAQPLEAFVKVLDAELQR